MTEIDVEKPISLDELIDKEESEEISFEIKEELESIADEELIKTIVHENDSRKRKNTDSNPTTNPIHSEKEEKLMELVFGDKKKFRSKLTIESNTTHESINNNDRRRPAWHDSGDEDVDADDVIDYTKKGAPFVRKEGKYTNYLKKNFQTLLGTPKWANLDREIDSDNSDADDDLNQTVGFITKTSSATLLKNQLKFKRLKDLNRATYIEGPGINAIEFHPSSSVALVAGRAGVATIYSIDGQKNDKLHSIEFKNFPIKCCRIGRAGAEAIVGSSKKYYYTYDLMAGASQRVFLPKTITKMTNFELSPCGKYLAVIGRFGELHLLDAITKELIATMKQENECSALAFSCDSKKLYAHSADAEVSIFDIREHRMMHRFVDEGCINGTSICISPCGNLLACGSAQGVVNIYNSEGLSSTNIPKPLKTIFNLTTSITAMKFNHTTEMLAICSREINDSMKIVHFPSGTVFSNFPDSQCKFGKPNVLAFSPQSGYLAVGNLSKEVALFRLKHFSNY